MDNPMKKLFILFLLLVPLTISADEVCWEAPTTYEDDSLLAISDITSYKLVFDGTTEKLYPSASLIPCKKGPGYSAGVLDLPVGSHSAVGYTYVGSLRSAPSNVHQFTISNPVNPTLECITVAPAIEYYVPQYKTYLTRPLYDAVMIALGVKTKIGAVPFDALCEPGILYSTTRSEYHKVIGYPGAALCRKR